jgi:hypothetical protein
MKDVDLTPLETVGKMMQSEQYNALEVAMAIKRAEEFLKAQKHALIAPANQAFVAMQKTAPDKKRWTLLDGKGIVRRYTPRSTWRYSPEVVKLESELKAKQKQEQIDGKATRLVPEVDPKVGVLFSLNCTESF